MLQVLIAVISVGVSLAGIQIVTTLYLAGRINSQGKEIATLAERVSRLEGLIEGLFRPRPVLPSDEPDKPSTSARTGTDG